MPILLLPFLTRVLTPADYGLVAMFSVFITLCGAFTGLSTHGAVGMRYFDRDSIDFPQYVGTCLFILVISTAVLSIIIFLFAPKIETYTQINRNWQLLAVLVSGFQFLLLIRLAIFQSAKQAVHFSAFRVSQAMVDAGITLLLIAGFSLAWEGRLIGLSSALILVGGVATLSMFADGWVKLIPSKAALKSALAFGLPLIPHVIGGAMLVSMDRVVITNVIGVSALGIYVVATQIGLGIYLLADAANRAMSPWQLEAMKQNKSDQDIKIVRYGALFFMGLIAIALLLGATAPFLMTFLVGPEFRAAADFVWLIALGQAFGGMYLYTSNIIFYFSKTAALSSITISCGIVNIVLTYILINRFDLIGAAISFWITQMLMLLLTFIVSQRLRPLPWLSLLTLSAKRQ